MYALKKKRGVKGIEFLFRAEICRHGPVNHEWIGSAKEFLFSTEMMLAQR